MKMGVTVTEPGRGVAAGAAVGLGGAGEALTATTGCDGAGASLGAAGIAACSLAEATSSSIGDGAAALAALQPVSPSRRIINRQARLIGSSPRSEPGVGSAGSAAA